MTPHAQPLVDLPWVGVLVVWGGWVELKKQTVRARWMQETCADACDAWRSLCSKGGDPAAPSDTATLLRLRPNRQSHLRPLPPSRVGPWASGVTNFHDVTGGVYKARERIHRSIADLRLLATPTSWGRVADPNPN